MIQVSRRVFLKGAGIAAASTIVPACESATKQQAGSRGRYAFFNTEESAFVEAAVARLIPADELGPGAREADVAIYIDRQLAGAWGAGERLYRAGPWDASAKPTMGYQLPYTPAELFRNALRAVDVGVRLLRTIYVRHRTDWQWRPSIERLAGTDELRSAVEQGTIDALLAKWTREADEFQERSRKYWIY